MPAESTQTAHTGGYGNVVVQIVGERNAVTVGGATALRLREYQGADFATAPVVPGRAGQPGWTATGRRETRILYLSGCETSLAASAMRRALAMSSGPARPSGLARASLRRALRRSATTWSGVLPSSTRWRRAL